MEGRIFKIGPGALNLRLSRSRTPISSRLFNDRNESLQLIYSSIFFRRFPRALAHVV